MQSLRGAAERVIETEACGLLGRHLLKPLLNALEHADSGCVEVEHHVELVALVVALVQLLLEQVLAANRPHCGLLRGPAREAHPIVVEASQQLFRKRFATAATLLRVARRQLAVRLSILLAARNICLTLNYILLYTISTVHSHCPKLIILCHYVQTYSCILY